MSAGAPARELRTERLLLKSARPGDGAALREAIGSSLPELYPWLSFSARLSEVSTLEQVSREAAEMFEEREFFVWRIWEPEGRTMVGSIDLHSFDWDVPCGEIGYWLRTSHTGRGLAREAVGAVLELAWEELGLLRVEARCDTRNERSWRLVERLGFTFEGVARDDDRDAAGELCSTRVYSLLRGEAARSSS